MLSSPSTTAHNSYALNRRSMALLYMMPLKQRILGGERRCLNASLAIYRNWYGSWRPNARNSGEFIWGRLVYI